MPGLNRRYFILSAVAIAGGCATRLTTRSAASRVREPALGQFWHYAKHDQIKRTVVDTEITHVVAVRQIIELESRTQSTQDVSPDHLSWGSDWLRKYGLDDPPASSVLSEIQVPWGMVLVDPHWAELQVYENPIPLWPTELRPGWSSTVSTRYKTATRPNDALPWQLTMRAHQWESVTVPAGQFSALRYTNIIDFQFPFVTERTAAQRLETIWFAPEIGRWIVRESMGSFREDLGTEVSEGSYRWELLSWS